MIFHKKFFQCVTAPIPLFLTPQKIGLLSNIESAQFDTINRTIKGLMLPSAVTYVHSKGDSSQNGKTFSYPIHITRSGPDRRSVSFLIQCGTYIQTNSSLPHISLQNPSVTCMPFSFRVSYTF